MMSSSSVISTGKPNGSAPAKKTNPTANPPSPKANHPKHYPNKPPSTKPGTTNKYNAPPRTASKNTNNRPSMARMIEVARNAEARRRAENPDNTADTANPVTHPGTQDTPQQLNRSATANPITRKPLSSASSNDDVKTAGVLKKAAEAARAKKELSPRPLTYHKKPTQPTRDPQTGKPASDNSPNTETHSGEQRSRRAMEAIRHLKETDRETTHPEHRHVSQQRLTETLADMNLNNPTSPILLIALTHPSYTFENPTLNKENNQRLEFLGDAVLDFIVGEYLYQRFPDKSEGELTKIRAAVVNESTLAKAARNINLGESLHLGRGEQVSGGRERSSILADALEALIGAYYLQEGFETVRQFVLDLLIPIIEEVNQDHYNDFKTLLQEVAQHNERTVSYRIIEELGPDHDKSFTAGVFVQGVLKGKGTGKTKKEAEQHAARLTLENWEVSE